MFKNHPKGLLLAALSNMGERFGYYIMNAVLVLFLCSKFGLSDETSGLIAAIFLAAIYVLSLAGGAIADRTQNYKATISWGLVIMATWLCDAVGANTVHTRQYFVASAADSLRPGDDCLR